MASGPRTWIPRAPRILTENLKARELSERTLVVVLVLHRWARSKHGRTSTSLEFLFYIGSCQGRFQMRNEVFGVRTTIGHTPEQRTVIERGAHLDSRKTTATSPLVGK